jgi:antitoxin MazE
VIVAFRKWGNSIAVRIPKSFAEAIGAVEGKWVRLTVADGALVLRPLKHAVPERRYTLDQLLSGMSRDNVPPEVDWGPPRDNEAW